MYENVLCICSIIDDYFDYLVKLISARFSHCKMICFPFLISTLRGDTLRVCRSHILHQNLTTSFICPLVILT